MKYFKYLECASMLQEQKLNEGNPLSRFFQAFDGKDYVFAVISASRSGMTKQEDKQKNKELRDDIRRRGFGYKEVRGSWVDDNSGEVVEDDSSIIMTAPKHADALFDDCKEWCKKYNQDGFMFKDEDGHIAIYDRHGIEDTKNKLNKFNPNKTADYMTTFKKKRWMWDYKKDKDGNYIYDEKGEKIPERVLRNLNFNISETYKVRRPSNQFGCMILDQGTPKYLRERMDVEYEYIDY